MKPITHSQNSELILPKGNYSISFSGNIENNSSVAPGENPEDDTDVSGSTCAFCKNQFEGTQLGRLSVYPICESCRVDIARKTFPLWVKLFFTGVLILVAFSIFWNWRFYSAYQGIKNANIAAGKGDIAGAAEKMGNAGKQVPEVKEIAEMASYYKGIDLLNKDKSTEALSEFENCVDLSADLHINELTLQAQMASGFDKKDYKLFLTSAKTFLQLDTTKAVAWASVASAYACLYAQSNLDSLRQQSFKYYNRSKAMDDTSADEKEFLGRILYRLDTKQIITKEQFDKQYPNGYPSK